MAFSGLEDFIKLLEQQDELVRVKKFVNPDLEITEISDRLSKAGGKAILFENTGTDFPLLINMYGSEKRMSLAIGRENLEEAGKELEQLFKSSSAGKKGLLSKLKFIPQLKKIAGILPRKIRSKGICQQIVNLQPDLDKLPILKCWPHDGGPFITLPVVHTKNPVNGEVNAGMYRMQVLDKQSTGMHWHRHKTGANHYKEYKERGELMPIAVTLGGDPVYTYSATAPLPEGIDEYILAGFLRKKKVKLVKCITQDIYVPEDVDIVIEGYVDPGEDLVWEGPFGDHTGYYSLADWYPRFHLTAITYRKNAVYPATIVGVPPMEDATIGLATERLFLYPLRLTMQPDIVDFHMPTSGVAHNLILVKIRKTYPGQGLKVINALFGAGQMMFSKFIVVFDEDIDLKNYKDLISRVFLNCDFSRDLIRQNGPLDVLDHSSDNFSFGGKLGIDATTKHEEERAGDLSQNTEHKDVDIDSFDLNKSKSIVDISTSLYTENSRILLVSVNKDQDWRKDIENIMSTLTGTLVFVLDKSLDLKMVYACSWQILANTDPVRDCSIHGSSLLFDSTAKAHSSDKFPRRWPNVVVSDNETIKKVDNMWEELNIGEFQQSPSLVYSKLLFKGNAEVNR